MGVAGTGVVPGLLDEIITRFLAPPAKAGDAPPAAAPAAAAGGDEGNGEGDEGEEGEEGAAGAGAAGASSSSGRVAKMASHAHANYVLQAVLAATKTQAQVRACRRLCMPCHG